MSAERWKRQERAIAMALRSTRIPNNGAGQPDIRAAGWAVQVKTRKEIPAWLWAAIDQAQRDARSGEGWAVVLSEVSQGHKARRVVVLDFDTWAADIGASCDAG